MSAWTWILIVVILLVIVFAVAANFYFEYAITRVSHPMPGQKGQVGGNPWTKYKDRFDKDVAWDKAQKMEDVWIRSADGLKLHARFFAASVPAKRAVICCHGYRGAPFADFASSVPWLHENGCDLLLIDERTHGQSEGEYITYGAKEQEDIRRWAADLDAHYKGTMPLYLYGVSMGCSSVLMAAGGHLPASVKGVIADCGYSSMIHMFKDASSRLFHIPAVPLIWFLDLECRMRAKFAMKDADAAKAMATCVTPVLFIHGTADEFVLPENSKTNYDACKAKKKLVPIAGAQHACSYHENTAQYQAEVLQFFQETI